MLKQPAPHARKSVRLKPIRLAGRAHGLNETARDLVELMVWSGLDRNASAARLGISKDYGYRLMRDPSVLAHYQAECNGLRSSSKAQMIHRLEQLAEQDDNKNAAVGAIKVLLDDDDQPPAGAAIVTTLTPGYVIDCRAAYARNAAHEATPSPATDATLGYAIDLLASRHRTAEGQR